MGFSEDLNLQNSQLIHIARQFCDQVHYGMGVEDGDIKCLPAYIPVSHKVRGRALVLDVGGTRIRAAVVTIGDQGVSIEKGPVEDTIPLKRGIPLKRELFLKALADVIKRLEPEKGLPLGYCFSYPTASEPDGDARLIHWTKGVQVPGMEGEKVGRVLLEYLEGEGIACPHCVVLNDTTASLLAGVAQKEADAHIGLVVGTGNNMATWVGTSSMPKLDPSMFNHDRLPVNLESGNFSPPHLTIWDDQVDRTSDNPGKQHFEKAVSGAYLARVMQAVKPCETIDVDKGAALLSQWLQDEAACAETKQLAGLILDRSASLVAASLAGLLLYLNGERPIQSVMIVAEGGLIHNAPGFKKKVEDVLEHLVQCLELPSKQIQIVRIPNANLMGSAWAALS